MQSNYAHPLLAQLPLTVSPFIDLPKSATLPYTYKVLPPSLGVSAIGDGSDQSKARYVVTLSGHAAHPAEVVAACQALNAHLERQRKEAEISVREWESSIRERELAEKRRVAPGWLDREEKLLQPTRTEVPGIQPHNVMDSQEIGLGGEGLVEQRAEEGSALDRAFGGMGLS